MNATAGIRRASLTGLLLALAMPVASAARTVDDPRALLEADGTPLEPGEWQLEEASLRRDHLEYRYVRGDEEMRIFVAPRGQSRHVRARSASFDIGYAGGRVPPGSARARLFHRVVERIRANDPGGLDLPRLPPALGEVDPQMSLPAQWSWMVPLDRLQVAIAALLWLTVLGLFPLLVHTGYALWRTLTPSAKGLLAAGTVGGALLRLWVPHRLVMIFMGYRAAAEVAQFTTVPKYGAGAFVLHRAAFELFGPSHDVIIATHTALGILSIPLAALLLRGLGAEVKSAGFGALFFAFLPIFVKDHRSESILVPAVFLLLGGSLLWLRSLQERRFRWVFAALPFFVLGAITRPELSVVALALPVALAWMIGAPVHRHPWGPRSPWVLGAAALLGVLLATPHLVHLARAVRQQVDAGALPALTPSLAYKTFTGLVWRNAVTRFETFPVPLTAAALAELFLARGSARRRAGGLLLLGTLWIALYYMDLPRPSIPRLHAPGALLFALAAACAIGRWLAPIRPSKRSGGAAALAVAGLVLASLPSALHLWAPTNEDTEEALVHQAVDALPSHPVCFVRIGDRDPPPVEKTHRYFPDYLLRPPHRADSIYGIGAWLARGRHRCRESYFFFGLRCYAIYAHDGHPKRGRPVVVDGCAKMQQAVRLRPVFERVVPNYGQNEFGYWPEVESFRVGLYRIEDTARSGRGAKTRRDTVTAARREEARFERR